MDYNTSSNINRSDWEFSYPAGVLAKAAEKKREYRQSRVEWWEKRKAELMLEVKESGLEVSESIATGYSNGAGSGPKVMVRTDLQTKLTECHTRIQKHLEYVREYDGWAQVLSANLNSTLQLKHGDWLFFFGRE